MARPSAFWIDGIAAIVGGLVLGIGVTRMILEFTLLSSLLAVVGFIILWWALTDVRIFRRGHRESESKDTHTIE